MQKGPAIRDATNQISSLWFSLLVNWIILTLLIINVIDLYQRILTDIQNYTDILSTNQRDIHGYIHQIIEAWDR